MSPGYDGLFEKWELRIARRVLRRFQKSWPCLRKEPHDDLLQECLSHWHVTKTGLNPIREASQGALMMQVVWNKLTDLVRTQVSDKRKVNSLTVSLDLLIDDAQGDDRTTGSDFPAVALGDDLRADPNRLVDLKMDLHQALLKLTSRQCEICRLLPEMDFNLREVSDYLNLTRGAMRGEIKRIRAVFQAEKLHEYLS